jgi:uncharacterized OsmC-like protein
MMKPEVYKTRQDTSRQAPAIVMLDRQTPLIERYKANPDTARITDHATSSSARISAADPLYGEVIFGDINETTLSIGVHKAVGGESDLPIPGEILCGAIASCLDTVIRIVANRLGLTLTRLAVHVDAHVDLRGTLRVDPAVPAGFSDIDIRVDFDTEQSIPPEMRKAILKGAEQSCVVLQTLRNPPAISLELQELDAG